MTMQRTIGVFLVTMAICSAAATVSGSNASPLRVGQHFTAQWPGAAQPRDGSETSPLVLADAHPYRHCHYIHTRVYCHKSDRLPMNWPPNTDTPHGQTYENPPGPPEPMKRRRGT